MIRHSYIGFLIVLAASVACGADENRPTSVHHGIKAKPILRTAPSYPRTELIRNKRGWVQLSYVVTADGKVIDPIIERSSGSEQFEKSALRSVERWTYVPATWDGVPVQQCITKVMITFSKAGTGTFGTKNFYRRYKTINKAINAGEFSNARELIDEVVDKLNHSLSEAGWIWTLRARLEGLAGDKDAQLIALRQATANNGRWVSKKHYPDLLLARTVLALENGNFSEALSSHDKLLKTKGRHPQMENLQPYINAVREIVASEDVLSVPALIGEESECINCASNWQYRPLRRKFSISDVSGSLRNIEFRCQWRRVVDVAREDSTWSLPEAWGTCSIIVFGEPGTTFNLLELPTDPEVDPASS